MSGLWLASCSAFTIVVLVITVILRPARLFFCSRPVPFYINVFPAVLLERIVIIVWRLVFFFILRLTPGWLLGSGLVCGSIDISSLVPVSGSAIIFYRLRSLSLSGSSWSLARFWNRRDPSRAGLRVYQPQTLRPCGFFLLTVCLLGNPDDLAFARQYIRLSTTRRRPNGRTCAGTFRRHGELGSFRTLGPRTFMNMI
jgi:hypothetical protein